MGIVLTALLFGSFVFCTPAISHAIGDPDIRARITNIRRSSYARRIYRQAFRTGIGL